MKNAAARRLSLQFLENKDVDARNRLPNTQWHLLKLLAKTGGQLSWEDSEASDNFKKKKQLLADTLKAFFRIKNDPFYPVQRTKGLSHEV